MADIEIEIDGRKLTAKPNQTVIQVADEAGIYIPRFCYHKHLSIPANCRMCLVEVEKAPKTLPACATPVAPGMKVFTQSSKTLLAQRAVMEFLLINHPLDCPICDQGGECELQDLSMGYGASRSKFNEYKRAVADENLGPLIATEMTRCILCTRCIRFGDEIAGIRELGMTFRGEHEEVTTFVEQAMSSEVSGNIIDLCPVGALTSKPYRFTARAWELDQAPSISPHDCMGSNLNVHTRYGKVMRVVSRENQNINQTWISDRDRFSYAGLYHADRLSQPMVRINGVLTAVEWQDAFLAAEKGLQSAIAEHGADKIGALASPNSTLEEFYLLQKIMRELGSQNIDYRLRESDVKDQNDMPAFPGLGISFSAIEECDAILLIGSNLQKEQPLAALRVRKAIANGGTVVAINPVDYAFNFKVAAKSIVAPHQMIQTLSDLVSAIKSSSDNAIAKQLKDKKKIHIILGALSLNHPEASSIRALAQEIASLTGATMGLMTSGANAAGAWLAGAIPHRQPGGVAINHQGLDAYSMLQKPRQAYVLLNVEPALDMANAHLATAAIKQAKFVIALSMYHDPVLFEHADVILPLATFTETSGTFVNAMGEWQSFKGMAKPFAASRPGWKVLRVLGNFLKLSGFDYESSDQVRNEVKIVVDEKLDCHGLRPRNDKDCHGLRPRNDDNSHGQRPRNDRPVTLSRIGETPIYSLDSLVRRSKPLQQTEIIIEGDITALRIHPETAEKFKLQAGDTVSIKQARASARFSVAIDERIARDAVWLASGIPTSSETGDLFGEIEIEKG